jgi:hypothetical protein
MAAGCGGASFSSIGDAPDGAPSTEGGGADASDSGGADVSPEAATADSRASDAADASDAPTDTQPPPHDASDGGAEAAPEAAAPCASTCPGCCEPDGGCAPGVTTLACGANGAACAVCTGAQLCVDHPPEGVICL